MKKRVKKELTLKEAKGRCAIITIVVSSIVIIPVLLTLVASGVNDKTIVGFICMFMLPFFLYLLLNMIFRTDRLEFEEKLKKERELCQDFLSKETYTQVVFLPQERSCEAEMLFSILENTGCTFFAKFDNEDNIILIVKDKENKEVYKAEIENYYYFNLRFKKKEQ